MPRSTIGTGTYTYTLTINILSLILNVLPRYLYQRFLQMRPQITVLHHIMMSLVYEEYILNLFSFVFLVGNYFPVSVLAPLLKNNQACSITSITVHLYMFYLFLGILLISLTKLLINKTPFWYNGLDHDRLKTWVHISLAVGSITVCLAGYRAFTWNYCDWAIYDFILSVCGIVHDGLSGQEPSQNYPDLVFFICMATFFHFVTVFLEWKRDRIDPLRSVAPQGVQVVTNPVAEIEAPVSTISAWSDANME